jgi:hypothetical protein
MLYKIILTVYYKDGITEENLNNAINYPFGILVGFKMIIDGSTFFIYLFLYRYYVDDLEGDDFLQYTKRILIKIALPGLILASQLSL